MDSEPAIYDVDDGPMMSKRRLVMNICIVQGILSLTLLVQLRRAPVLLVLEPFFLAAAILGYNGAKRCNAIMVAAHFLGSAGLSLVFMTFILAQAFLQRSEADLLFFALNFPTDLFLLVTSVASVNLYRALSQLRAQLRPNIARVHAARSAFGGGGGGGGGLLQGSARGADSERAALREYSLPYAPEHSRAPGSRPGSAAESLHADLLCPITLEVMRDPVIASDGHSYERAAIERWLAGHRTSPLTGRALPHGDLIPNHRLRSLIEGVERQPAPNPAPAPAPAPAPGPDASEAATRAAASTEPSMAVPPSSTSSPLL